MSTTGLVVLMVGLPAGIILLAVAAYALFGPLCRLAERMTASEQGACDDG